MRKKNIKSWWNSLKSFFVRLFSKESKQTRVTTFSDDSLWSDVSFGQNDDRPVTPTNGRSELRNVGRTRIEKSK